MKRINKNIFIFIFGILLVAGCNNNEEIPKKVELPQKNADKEIYDSASIDGESIKIIVRNASYPINDPGGNSLSENYQLRERQMEIPLSQTALILIDTWDSENQRFQNSRKINIARMFLKGSEQKTFVHSLSNWPLCCVLGCLLFPPCWP